MEFTTSDKLKNQIINQFKNHSILPIIGSGFTKSCESLRGRVPSGCDYKAEMLKAIKDKNIPKNYDETLTDEEYSELENSSFNEISEMYHAYVDKNYQRRYLLNNFSKVLISSQAKIDFLNIDWSYIYTLNTDDGIENNSEYSYVILPNQKTFPQVFDENKCVIKLHGDIHEILKYTESDCEIFDTKQYIKSIHDNEALLTKLKNDYQHNNIIFVGCSLSNELDILSVSSDNEKNTENNIYFCHVDDITVLQKIQLKKYGITHCIKFDSYDEIYSYFINAYHEAKSIQVNELDKCIYNKIAKVSPGFNNNMPYFLQGKSAFTSCGNVILPHHYFHRDIVGEVLKKMSSYSVFIVSGSGCSGKTYFGIEMIERVRNKTVYFFEAKQSLSFSALQNLINIKNALFVFDYHSISNSQIECILKNITTIKENYSNAIILTSKNNRDLPSIINYLSQYNHIDLDSIYCVDIKNKLSTDEIDELNPLLVQSSIPIMNNKNSIVDNIIKISKELTINNRYTKTTPNTSTVRHIACLIMLAVKIKIYSEQAIGFDLLDELNQEVEAASPMIEKEYSLLSEKSSGNNSPQKYVLNATYWLNNELSLFAIDNSDKIIEAYQYIVRRCILLENRPNLYYGKRDALYKDYILYDNINHIFSHQSRNLDLIRNIYMAINDELSNDPNYLHQRAKCLIRSSFYELDKPKKIDYLDKAMRDSVTSASIFENRLSKSDNEKIAISLAHAKYTYALCLCHICRIHSYSSIDENTKALHSLIETFNSQCVDYEYIKNDRNFNYKNAVKDIITQAITTPEKFNVDSKDINYIFQKIR